MVARDPLSLIDMNHPTVDLETASTLVLVMDALENAGAHRTLLETHIPRETAIAHRHQ